MFLNEGRNVLYLSERLLILPNIPMFEVSAVGDGIFRMQFIFWRKRRNHSSNILILINRIIL